MYALAPPHRRYDRDGPVVRRFGFRPSRILPRPTRAGLCFHFASGFRTCPTTRAHVRLLGPCFKTGRTGYRPIRHRRRVGRETPARRTIAVRGHWRQSPQVERPQEHGARNRPRTGLPRSASGPTQSGSITPSPKRRSPSPDASDRRRTGRGAPNAESAPVAARYARAEAAVRHAPTRAPSGLRVESDARTLRSSPFASRRFHVLLNSLFKVLFNFPSRYLCAIGLVSVFSLRWSLPPALGCNLKQPDS